MLILMMIMSTKFGVVVVVVVHAGVGLGISRHATPNSRIIQVENLSKQNIQIYVKHTMLGTSPLQYKYIPVTYNAERSSSSGTDDDKNTAKDGEYYQYGQYMAFNSYAGWTYEFREVPPVPKSPPPKYLLMHKQKIAQQEQLSQQQSNNVTSVYINRNHGITNDMCPTSATNNQCLWDRGCRIGKFQVTSDEKQCTFYPFYLSHTLSLFLAAVSAACMVCVDVF